MKSISKVERAVANNDFAREVLTLLEKVAYRVGEPLPFESMVSRETSMKKSICLGWFLNYSRKVLQKMKIANTFFANTVKHMLFYGARYRIWAILEKKKWFYTTLSSFFCTQFSPVLKIQHHAKHKKTILADKTQWKSSKKNHRHRWKARGSADPEIGVPRASNLPLQTTPI